MWLICGVAAAADPNEGLIQKFMGSWFPVVPDSTITMETKDVGPGFAVYYIQQIPKDKKNGDQQPAIYLPGPRQIIIGDYFNLSRYKAEDINAKFIGDFLSSAMGMSFKASQPAQKTDLPEFNLDQETGYGKVRLKAFLFGKVHLMLGQKYPVDGNAREFRMKNINPKMGGSMGEASAPHHLYVFLDLECPHCAKLEKDLIPLLKERKDWQATFLQFPLVMGHVIAFKAAAAAYCFKAADPKLYFDFMDWFYPQRTDLDLSSVDAACLGFAQMHGIEEKFLGCYMQEPNVRSVLDTLQMGTDAGVRYTPAIYLDGASYGPADLLNLLKPAAAEPKDAPKAQAPTP